jgi:hypothetical protein
MRITILAAALLLVLPFQAMAQNTGIMTLLSACQRGNMSTCQAIQPIIGNACRQGQQQACTLQISIVGRRLNGGSAEAVTARALHRRCFSGDALACRRIQDGPKPDTADRRLDLPGMSR